MGGGNIVQVVDIKEPEALTVFTKEFMSVLEELYDGRYADIVLLCIGTDRVIGDCLGPLVGYKLSSMMKWENVSIYGTLDNPVHAKNICRALDAIKVKHKFPFVIAIDACLSKYKTVGSIIVKKGSIVPGAGFNKNLPKVGNMHVVGVVNTFGSADYVMLQNTRLSLVMKMAEIISQGIYLSLENLMLEF